MSTNIQDIMREISNFLINSPGTVNARSAMALEDKTKNLVQALNEFLKLGGPKSYRAYVKSDYEVLEPIDVKELVKRVARESANEAADRAVQQTMKQLKAAVSEVVSSVDVIRNQEAYFRSLANMLTDDVPNMIASVERMRKMDELYKSWLKECGHSYGTRISATGFLVFNQTPSFIDWLKSKSLHGSYVKNKDIFFPTKRLMSLLQNIKKIDPELGGELYGNISRYAEIAKNYTALFIEETSFNWDKKSISSAERAMQELDVLVVEVTDYIDSMEDLEPDYVMTVLKSLDDSLKRFV